MTRTITRQFDPHTLAVLHRTGTLWRGVIAHVTPAARGSAPGTTAKPKLLAHRTFSSTEGNQLDGWLDQHDVGKVICVLHASSVICRTCPLPDASAEHLAPALRLQAEAHLFGIAPPHRMGMAVLEAAPGETSRSGIILAWPESAVAERPPTSRNVQFAPDVASLACLLDGMRPTQPLAWIDRQDGSLALAVAHASGAVFRGLREDVSDVEAWKKSVGRVFAETCLSVGHTPSFVESVVTTAQDAIANMKPEEARLLAPPEILSGAKSRLEQAPVEDEWWATYGIAAGVVLACASELAPLTELRESAPSQKPTPFSNIVETLSSRKMAAIAVTACILLLMFGPFVFNGLRLAILSIKYPEQTRYAELARISNIRNQIVMYQELNRNSWSTTKILSDIVSNTPEGIELEFIRVNPTRSFTVRGRAIRHGDHSATEVIGLMRQYLNESGIFHDAALHWREPDAYGSYQFDISASMIRPYRRHDYTDELDFARWTLADRMRGVRPSEREDGDSALASAAGDDDITQTISDLIGVDIREDVDSDREDYLAADDPYGEYYDYEEEDRRAATARPGFDSLGSGRGRDTAGSVSDRTDGPVASAAHDIPPPMTREEIQLMSEPEVRDTLNRVAAARDWARARRDTDLQERLRAEFDWLMERIRSFQ